MIQPQTQNRELIEIEFEKAVTLTKEQYNILATYLKVTTKKPLILPSSLFDNEGWKLHEKKVTLRSRFHGNVRWLTLKEPNPNTLERGRLETHIINLSRAYWHDLRYHGHIPQGTNICQALKRLNLEGPFFFLEEILIHRHESVFHEHKVCLDMFFVLGETHYSVEVEGVSQDEAKKLLKKLLEKNHIPYEKAISKRNILFNAIINS